MDEWKGRRVLGDERWSKKRVIVRKENYGHRL